MPKKVKKGKKGKSKGKKGKKGGKTGKGNKAERKENVVQMAKQNAAIWETRLQLMDKSRVEYREAAKRFADENSALDDMLRRTERDTIEVISHLKKQEQTKDEKIYQLTEDMKSLKLQHRKEKETLIKDMGFQMMQLEEQLAQKDNDIQLMQNELRVVKEFRRKRGQMQKELDEIKESLLSSEKEHQDTLSQLERKFVEEKMRLQQEANQKISELAGRAQAEAIGNLEEASRSVFKENVRLTEALSIHMKEADKLKRRCDKLKKERDSLRSDLEISETLMKEKVTQAQSLKNKCKQLEMKVENLETVLNHMMREFQRKEKDMEEKHAVETDSARKELAKLRHLLEMKAKEMAKVKFVARTILEQRTDVEKFFVESLEIVRKEIQYTQEQYKKDAQRAYTKKMMLAHTGKSEFPAVRTFQKSDVSTNSVYMDMQAAEKILETQLAEGGKIDISDLTWEQRERVLRYLFARMNQQTNSGHSLLTSDKFAGASGGYPLISAPAQGAALMRQFYQQEEPMLHLDEKLHRLLQQEESDRLTMEYENGTKQNVNSIFVTQAMSETFTNQNEKRHSPPLHEMAGNGSPKPTHLLNKLPPIDQKSNT